MTDPHAGAHGDPLAPPDAGEGTELDPGRLHPAEHRAYRELNAAGRQLLQRWEQLSRALDGTDAAIALDRGAERVRRLLVKVERRTLDYGLSGRYAAQAAGAGLATARGAVVDRTVDTGMALRFAVLDIEHIATLLAHLEALADAREDDRLAAFNHRWSERIRTEVKAVRKVAVELGHDPDRTAAPLSTDLLTRAAHGAGWVVGTLGEAWDRIAASRDRGREED